MNVLITILYNRSRRRSKNYYTTGKKKWEMKLKLAQISIKNRIPIFQTNLNCFGDKMFKFYG